MPTLFGTLLGKGGVHKSISFEDFSLGTAQEAEEALSPKKGELEAKQQDEHAPPTPTATTKATTDAKSTWAFLDPGRNNNPNATSPGADLYDHTHLAGDDARGTWAEIIKSDRIRSFNSLDRDADGFISASDLKAALGPDAEVDQLIAAADKAGNGKVDFADFSELLRNS